MKRSMAYDPDRHDDTGNDSDGTVTGCQSDTSKEKEETYMEKYPRLMEMR